MKEKSEAGKLLSAGHVMGLFGLKDASEVKTVSTSVIEVPMFLPDEGTEEIPSSGELYRNIMDESKVSGKPWEAKVNPDGDEQEDEE